jgi:hypothetical protein
MGSVCRLHRDRPRCRRRRAQPGAPTPPPVLRAAGLWAVRRRLHDHRPRSLRLRQPQEQGTCGNNRTILRPEIDERVLAGLKERLLAPDLFQEFAREVQRELEARTRDADRERVRLERDLAAIDRKIERC